MAINDDDPRSLSIDIDEDKASKDAPTRKEREEEDDEQALARREYEEQKIEKEAANRRAQQAEDQARRLAEQNYHFARSKVEAENLAANHALAAVQAELDTAKRVYAEAMANQDYATAAEAQGYMNSVGYRMQKIDEIRQQTEAARNIPYAPPQIGDPTENLLRSVPPKTADWLRKHPEVMSDPEKKRLAITYHNLAVHQHGLNDTSDEYFQFIEDGMGYSKRDDAGEREPPRKYAPAAPVSRRGGSGRTEVTLTREEREYADTLGMTAKEYAENKRAISEGRAGKLRFG